MRVELLYKNRPLSTQESDFSCFEVQIGYWTTETMLGFLKSSLSNNGGEFEDRSLSLFLKDLLDGKDLLGKWKDLNIFKDRDIWNYLCKYYYNVPGRSITDGYEIEPFHISDKIDPNPSRIRVRVLDVNGNSSDWFDITCHLIISLDDSLDNKFPYNCVVIKSGLEFTPILIDYDGRSVWHQTSQASDSGDWYHFSQVLFTRNKNFKPLESIHCSLCGIEEVVTDPNNLDLSPVRAIEICEHCR